jgi:mRNA-degrading endonuclease YafQ of YafQ-DinJ toxin-antitoxin module
VTGAGENKLNAERVKDLRLKEGATKEENWEPWMEHLEKATKKIDECFKSKEAKSNGYCRIVEKLSAQPADLWGWATVDNGIIKIKVQYGMGNYPPQRLYNLSLHNWDLMWMSKEYYTEMVCRFMQKEIDAEKQAEAKKENDAQLAREKKIQDELEAKRVAILEKISKERENELNEIKAHPWKYAWRKFWENHIAKDVTPAEDVI